MGGVYIFPGSLRVAGHYHHVILVYKMKHVYRMQERVSQSSYKYVLF